MLNHEYSIRNSFSVRYKKKIAVRDFHNNRHNWPKLFCLLLLQVR